MNWAPSWVDRSARQESPAGPPAAPPPTSSPLAAGIVRRVDESKGGAELTRPGWKRGRIVNDTRERGMTGEGPVIVYHHDVSGPTFVVGLALVAWL